MNKQGPVIVIEDDREDQFMLDLIFTDLAYPNEIKYFTSGRDAIEYLNNTDVIPFLILSDISMPKEDGFALRARIQADESLSIKCIPYIFFTTASSKAVVREAYSLSAQGFFRKPSVYNELRDTISAIMSYWQKCYSRMSAFEPV